MEIEKRLQGKRTKYYLAHAVRLGGNVRKLRRFLGSDLSPTDISRLLPQAQRLLKRDIEANQNPLLHRLAPEEILRYGQYSRKIQIEHLNAEGWRRFTEKFTYHTNAIEGSAVSKEDVRKIIEKKQVPREQESIEAANVAAAVGFIRHAKERLSLSLILKVHHICFKGTRTFAGKFRSVPVVVKDSRGNIIHQGAPSSQVEKLLGELCGWYNDYTRKYPPLLLAAVVHDQFERIHPFQDGNGRVGRLLLNYVLLRHRYPPVNIYLKDRNAYYQCLQAFDRTGDVKPTLRFLTTQFGKTR